MNWRLLTGIASPYRWLLAGCAGLTALESGVALGLPWLGGVFAQKVLAGGTSATGAVLALLLLLFACHAALRFANSMLMGTTAARILADLRTRLYDHLQALPLSFHQRGRQGDLLALMTHEVGQLASFISGTLTSVGPLLLTVAGAIFFMAVIDLRLAGLVALLIPLFYLVLKYLGRELRPLALQLQKEHGVGIAMIDEDLSMLPAIKTFTREQDRSARYATQVDAIRLLSVRQQRIYSVLEPAIQFIAATAAVSLLWLASSRIGTGQMTPQQLVSFLLYAALLTRPVAGLADVYGQVQMARGTLERLGQVLTETPEPFTRAHRDVSIERGAIEFRRVAFTYPGREPVFSALDLKIGAGEIVALTGANGAGKSTIAHLLMRLHEPERGQILIDGHDIAKVGLRSLRRQIGIVPQHVLLFNGTVRDNILFGRPDATNGELKAAARLAQGHDFITALPGEYETIVGDHGVRLSGGQRQRIALARALLKNPPILVLDEATAMFDPEGERSFIADCRHFLANRTVILITHRPASLALADRVVSLEDGLAREAIASAPRAADTVVA